MIRFWSLTTVTCVLVLLLLSVPAVQAQEEEEAKTIGWFDDAELSMVLTEGNANTQTFGLKNTLRRVWERSRFQFRVEAVRGDTADDRYAVLSDPLDPTGPFVVREPGIEPDTQKYLAEVRYDRKITEKFTWNAGTSWDRNLDAGIVNRYIVFAGVGNIWWSREDLKFNTTYGLSYIDREEDPVDPTKDNTYPAFRFSWEYLNKFGKITTYTNNWAVNVSLEDPSDYFFDMTNGLTVAMSKSLALKVGLQWLYNNIPALEDLDLFLDEGQVIDIGTVAVERKQLDTVFTTSLVVSF